ncbi:RPM1-interacting protein 4-like [Impatiens glandulifera]|uniref:RPM1-interacting protein 4-like n=1 Tax=Impatiens glandulifera TaxID=253017 RepID=UPI001FB0EF54|nr:RPM1-interacting protein 4-like [Impatiens glandulifera]XP_047334901.1 RPM1-interacting protein 4-like [Impatiens glandulifera]
MDKEAGEMKSPTELVAKTANNVRKISGDGEIRKPSNSPLHHNANASEEVDFRKLTGSPYHQHLGAGNSGENVKRTARQVTGSDRSFDNSPLHPHSQAKMGGVRVSGVPSSANERRVSSEGSRTPSATPGRNLPRQVTRGDDSSEQAVVPKFGDWDESDPSAAEGLTQVFELVREERRSGGRLPINSNEGSQSNGRKPFRSESSPKKCCGCFSFGRK